MMDKLLEVSMMLGDAIKKLDALSAYKKPKTKKLYLWAYKVCETSDLWMQSSRYTETWEMGGQFIRLDYTAIEVEA